jgi:hypothetical protein
VFFNTRRFAFSHVGIYLGDNRFVHAPRRGREVEIATLDSTFWNKRFDGARRMVDILPEFLPAIVGEASAAAFDALQTDAELQAVAPAPAIPSVPAAAPADTRP